MGNQSHEKNNYAQLELLPTGKSEQSINSYNLIKDHLFPQDKIYKSLYKQIAEKLRDGGLSVGEIKQLGDFMRGAGSWVKQAQDALILAESLAINALDSNSGITLDLSGLDDSELEKAIEEYEQKLTSTPR